MTSAPLGQNVREMMYLYWGLSAVVEAKIRSPDGER